MLNKAILIGRLGRDPELRYTASGTPVANFSVATTERYKDKAGEKQERTEWHQITAWRKLAEIASQHLSKGSLIYLEGRLRTEEYEKDGQKRRATKIEADTIRFLDTKRKPDELVAGLDEAEPAKEAELVITDDDIPF